MLERRDREYCGLNEREASLVITSFLSIALYIVIELNFKIFTTFKAFRGLYFYSVLVATWGIALNAIGYLLRHHHLVSVSYGIATLILIGWASMVTGQSVVLYSRLHLIVFDGKILKCVAAMIVANALWLHIPVFVLVYGVSSPNASAFEHTYNIFERIQLSVFFAQEVIISALYIWQIHSFLSFRREIGNNSKSQVFKHLVYVNIIVVLLDISIIALEFSGCFDIQTAWKPLVYGTKLKLEFSILNRLTVEVQKGGSGNFASTLRLDSRGAICQDDVGLERVQPRENLHLTPTIEGQGFQVTVRRGHPATASSQAEGSASLSVRKTTEVTIHHQEAFKRTSRSLDSSVRASRGNGSDDVENGCISSTSSEAHFAARQSSS